MQLLRVEPNPKVIERKPMMTLTWLSRYWQLRLVGALAIAGAVGTVGCGAIAQVRPDNTLGTETSRVTTTGTGAFQIDGGATRGRNLFHSFSQFSVPTNGVAAFNNALSIQNIISRVTGRSGSNIDGLIRANGAANLFLINPNGIIFGPNARLNIGGSFVGSTANSLNFADGTAFSAKTPPTTPLLTVSVPIGLQYGQSAAGITQPSIVVNGDISSVGLQIMPGKTLGLVGGNVTLNGGILTAAGGRVELGGLTGAGTVGLNSDGNNLSLSYPQGVQRGDVSLSNGPVFFSNGAGFLPVSVVDVRARGGGSIAVNARNLDILNGSLLLAGISKGLGSVDSQAGNIDLRAQGQINIANSSISNNVESGAAGNAGNINLTAGSLSVTDGASLQSLTQGKGNSGGININTGNLSVTNDAELNTSLLDQGNGQAGDININAQRDVSFDGGFAFSRLEQGGTGTGGNINITTGTLSLKGITSQGNIGQVVAATFGNGNAGNVMVNARNGVTLDGRGSDIFTLVGANIISGGKRGRGNAGNIIINSNSLEVKNGARIVSRTESDGNAGNVRITASGSVSFDGVNDVPTQVLSDVDSGAVGNGGNVNVTAKSLSVTNGAQINTGTSGRGAGNAGRSNAGNVNIDVSDSIKLESMNRQPVSSISSALGETAVGKGGDINITAGGLLSLGEGARLRTDTSGKGDAGNVTIAARDIAFDGVGSNGLSSGAFSTVNPRAMGKGGDFKVTTGSLSLNRGAQINTSTSGSGDAGKVVVQANGPVLLTGSGTQVSSSVNSTGIGNAGEAFITAKSLSLTDGAQLRSSTSGTGNAGRVRVQTDGDVSLKGNQTSILTAVGSGAKGNGGSIDINSTAGSVSLTNGARLQADTFGQGDAGNVTIAARDIAFDGVGSNGLSSGAFSTVNRGAMGKGGDFKLTTGSLSLTRGAQINTSTSGTGDAGKVVVQANGPVLLTGSGTGVSSSVNSTGMGNAGEAFITAKSLSLTDGAQLRSSTSGTGNAGRVRVQTDGDVSLKGNQTSILSTVEPRAKGNGGSIDINSKAGSVSLTNGAQLQTATSGRGDAGRVTITASGPVSLDGVGSTGVSTNLSSAVNPGALGKGGEVNVTSESLFLTKGAQLLASTSGRGDAGSVNVTASGSVSLDGVGSTGVSSGAFTSVESTGMGKGGSVNVRSGSLALTNGAQLGTNTSGRGDAGRVTITASGPVSLDGVGSTGVSTNLSSAVNPGALGKGGEVNVTSESLFLTKGAQLLASTSGRGDAGSVNVTASGPVSFDGVGSTGVSSNVSSAVNPGALGKGGDINIIARSLYVTKGAQLLASTSGRGDAGRVTITASDRVSLDGVGSNRASSNLSSAVNPGAVGKGGEVNVRSGSMFLTKGAQLLASTSGRGDAGSVNVTASGPVSLDGVGTNGVSSNIGSAVNSGAVGKGGDVNVRSGSLALTNGAGVSVSSNGSESAGNLMVRTNSITLDRKAFLSAETASGNGGNIFLQPQDLLLLRHGSQISTTAGNNQNGGNGGIITINTPFIVAVPSENSDISANAFMGNGGRVDINIKGGGSILGTQFQTRPTSQSDITASSTGGGKNGAVNINTPIVNPSAGLVALPVVLADASQQIVAQSCGAGDGTMGSQFIVTGRGGLPPNPGEPLSSDAIWSDARLRATTLNQHHSQTVTAPKPSKQAPIPIVPATGWVFNNKGEVTLTALAPTNTPDIPWLKPTTCHAQ